MIRYDFLFIVGLILKIEGFAHCQWTESDSSTDSNGNSQNNDTTYRGDEKYIETTTYLISSLASKYYLLSKKLNHREAIN